MVPMVSDALKGMSATGVALIVILTIIGMVVFSWLISIGLGSFVLGAAVGSVGTTLAIRHFTSEEKSHETT